MAERELRPDGVMKRLARLLAEASQPPCPRTRLTEALLNGDFETLAGVGDDSAASDFAGGGGGATADPA